MSWLRAKPNLPRQPCPLPPPAQHARGAVWLCDICGRRWILRGDRWNDHWEVKLLPWPPRKRPEGGWPGHPLMIVGEGD